MERTLTIIKPDAVKARNVGNILSKLEKQGFRILGMKFVHLAQARAEGFYHVHRERTFFSSLVKFMTEGPVLVIALEKENAILTQQNNKISELEQQLDILKKEMQRLSSSREN